MAGILEEIRDEQKPEKRCGLKTALLGMKEPDRKETIQALLDAAIPSSAITTVLKRRGYRVNEWSVRRCRRCCECGLIDKGPGKA